MLPLRTWFQALRPWSFSMSIISVTLGAVWALPAHWSWGLYALSLMTMTALHGATNLFNDYLDVKNLVDTPDAPTVNYRPHPLVHRELSLQRVLKLAILLYVTGIALGIVLAALSGWAVLAIGLIGAGLSLAYTARPLALKYYGLGELVVFLVWGPLATSAAYYAQAESFSTSLLPVSVPFGVLVALTLLANNLRDVDYDRAKHIRTIAVLAGQHRSRILFLILLALAFLSVTVMSLTGPLTLWSLVVLAALGVAYPLCRMMYKEIPNDADARVAKLDIVFGVLLLVSVFLQRLAG